MLYLTPIWICLKIFAFTYVPKMKEYSAVFRKLEKEAGTSFEWKHLPSPMKHIAIISLVCIILELSYLLWLIVGLFVSAAYLNIFVALALLESAVILKANVLFEPKWGKFLYVTMTVLGLGYILYAEFISDLEIWG